MMDVCDDIITELTEEMKRAKMRLDDFGVYLQFRFDDNEKVEMIFVKSFGNNFEFEYRLEENNAINTQVNGVKQTCMGFHSDIQDKDDLLIGAISYINRDLNTSLSKLKIIERIKERTGYTLRHSTLLKEEKFNLLRWEASEDTL